MLNNLEGMSKAELRQVIETQQQHDIEREKEIQKLKDKNGKLETVADYLADVMENDGIENFTANYFNRDGKGFELICRYTEGKSVADVMAEQQSEIEHLQAEVERLKGSCIQLDIQRSDNQQRAEAAERRADEILERLGKAEAKLASVALTGSPFDEEALAKRDTEQQIKALDDFSHFMLNDYEWGFSSEPEGKIDFGKIGLAYSEFRSQLRAGNGSKEHE